MSSRVADSDLLVLQPGAQTQHLTGPLAATQGHHGMKSPWEDPEDSSHYVALPLLGPSPLEWNQHVKDIPASLHPPQHRLQQPGPRMPRGHQRMLGTETVGTVCRETSASRKGGICYPSPHGEPGEQHAG